MTSLMMLCFIDNDMRTELMYSAKYRINNMVSENGYQALTFSEIALDNEN